jgi:FAD:protein FMN transferase
MSRMSTDDTRHALNGLTMGTRWSALFFTRPEFDTRPVQFALQAAVDDIDAQMSLWKPDSALMKLNAAPVEVWVHVPAQLLEVLRRGLEIGRASGGAFDIGMGAAVNAWGFGPQPASPAGIKTAMNARHLSANEILEIDVANARVRKHAVTEFNLNGIAKGHGVDRLAESLEAFAIHSALVGIDGEMRAVGLRPDGEPWMIAIEAPEPGHRAPHSMLALHDAAIATSGDYRHYVTVEGRRLSHTMDPHRGAPLRTSPASVTVVAPRCSTADAWATALMVAGPEAGAALARQHGLQALFLVRDDAGSARPVGIGGLFSDDALASAKIEAK